MRQKIILFLLLVFVAWNNVAFSHENNNSWNGYWGSDCETERNVFNEIPFSYEYVDNLLIIYNRRPDRILFYEVIDAFGNLFMKGSVSKENSGQIIISVLDLPDNGIYTIILTSPYPDDRVWSQFEK